MGSCITKDPKMMGKMKKENEENKKIDTTGTNSEKIKQKCGIKNSPPERILSFNHAALRYSEFLFNKFKSSDGKPEQVSLGFMLNKCTVDIKNGQILMNYVNSSPLTIWVVYGGIEKVSETGLTVEIKDYKYVEEIKLRSSAQNSEEGDSLRPINLPQQPKECIMVVLEPELSGNQSLFMTYRYQILPQQKQYSLISQTLQWCSLSFRISDIYGSEYLFKCNDENQACSVCLTNKSQCILLPCRHMCVCSSCLEYIEKTKPNCPLCRKQYYSVVKYANANQ